MIELTDEQFAVLCKAVGEIRGCGCCSDTRTGGHLLETIVTPDRRPFGVAMTQARVVREFPGGAQSDFLEFTAVLAGDDWQISLFRRSRGAEAALSLRLSAEQLHELGDLCHKLSELPL